MDRCSIVIVGAGFSGTLVALHLLESSVRGVTLHLVEKGPRFGLGTAYSTSHPDHLLNVRAANMSAYADRPMDFVDWLAARTSAPPRPFSFVPRSVYGAYLQERLRAAIHSERGSGRLTLVQDEAVRVSHRKTRWEVELAIGRRLSADAVVIATGNNPPGRGALPDGSEEIINSAGDAYVGDPWAPGALDGVGPKDEVALLGAGLTMVDVVASLDALCHRGKIIAISRRGLAPNAHLETESAAESWTGTAGAGLMGTLRRLRGRGAAAADWRLVFDGLRPVTQDLWGSFSDAERRRFLRHLRPYWDIHRHRMAPEMAARIDGHRSAGRLQLVAGRLTRIRKQANGLALDIRPRGTRRIVRREARWLINCTGSEGDPRRSNLAVIRHLVEDGVVRPDAFGLGLDTNDAGRLISPDGHATEGLFGIGPITRGALWEVTAVPDIRTAALHLARLVAAETGV